MKVILSILLIISMTVNAQQKSNRFTKAAEDARDSTNKALSMGSVQLRPYDYPDGTIQGVVYPFPDTPQYKTLVIRFNSNDSTLLYDTSVAIILLSDTAQNLGDPQTRIVGIGATRGSIKNFK